MFQPQLMNRPVVVLSNNDGCVVSRTDEAKALGIQMGAPYFQIKDFCKRNNVAVFSSNYSLYGDLSRRIMKILAEWVPEMEVYSIDEAFLSFTGIKEEMLTDHAQKIRETLLQYTGIPVSIGIGPTKVLAKVANVVAKKNKLSTNCVYNLFENKNEDNILRKFPVEDIWGVGRKTAQKLSFHRIFTAYDLKYSNDKRIERTFTRPIRNIVKELRGQLCMELDLSAHDKKQIISSRSFGKPVFKMEDLQEAVAHHVSTAAEKLRKQKSIARAILVFIQTNAFKNTPQYHNSATITLLSGSSATNKLIKSAFCCLQEIYKTGYEYKKVGVIFMDLQKKSETQLDLFQMHDSAKDEVLMQVLDHVNATEGKSTLKFAACGIDPFWKMLSKMKSPNYSTRWGEIPKVNQ
ncbi:MAG: Y-family DNA polymerase [Bdellovibrionales bacterium]|nr:Y-family DNA polymerase [Bdellovibrionales bacterium]